MSEIKGQLLGIILVLAIFGAIASVLYKAFTDAADNVKTKMDTATIESKINQKSANNYKLLSFKE